MKAFIIVYSPTTFTVQGTDPVKQFSTDLLRTYADSTTVIEPGFTATLAPGIYGIATDGDDVPPAIAPDAKATAGTQYDLVILKGKDPWPKVIADQVLRTRTAFPLATDDALAQFLPARGV